MPDLSGIVCPLALPLAEDPTGWIPYPQFKGSTASLPLMGCHVSVLSPGHSPHPPHSHVEEEILLVVSGEAEIVIAASETDPAPRRERLSRGQFSYYPAWQHHTLRNRSDAPVTYLMFKWAGTTARAGAALEAGIFDARRLLTRVAGEAFSVERLFDAPTGWLNRLHAHTTVLQPGGGYAPHRDGHDVAIVLLEGSIETLGARLSGAGIVYCGRDTLHGMHNPSSVPARYIVFEFETAQPQGV